MKTNYFGGDLTDVSATKEALADSGGANAHGDDVGIE